MGRCSATTPRPGSAIATIPPDATPAATLEHLRNAPAPNAISGVIGLAVISISFAYLGWSTAAEVGGEIRRPGLFLPLSIIGSVIVVGGMYLLMNLVYLRVVPAAGMLELNSASMASHTQRSDDAETSSVYSCDIGLSTKPSPVARAASAAALNRKKWREDRIAETAFVSSSKRRVEPGQQRREARRLARAECCCVDVARAAPVREDEPEDLLRDAAAVVRGVPVPVRLAGGGQVGRRRRTRRARSGARTWRSSRVARVVL